MKYITTIKLTGLERRNNSVYGNPNWTLSGKREDGYSFYGVTVSDISASCRLDSCYIGKLIKIKYHYTKGGTCKVDSIEF